MPESKHTCAVSENVVKGGEDCRACNPYPLGYEKPEPKGQTLEHIAEELCGRDSCSGLPRCAGCRAILEELQAAHLRGSDAMRERAAKSQDRFPGIASEIRALPCVIE